MSKMITLYVNNGKVFVWNAKDWLTLREEHRIVGELVGCLAYLPRQESFPGLPLALLPEEVTLLIEQQVVHIVQNTTLVRAPSEDMRTEFKEYRKKLHADQIDKYKADRKRQVTGMIDQIIEGKRRKLLKLKKTTPNESESVENLANADLFDKDIVIQEELSKFSSMDEDSSIVQIFTAHTWHNKSDEKPFTWTYPETPAEVIRYRVFKHFWQKGYFITSGYKFGVDFLVYPGDPIKFHAHFLVVCLESTTPLPVQELVALGRLGTSVRKTVVLASTSLQEEHVTCQSLSWDGASR